MARADNAIVKPIKTIDLRTLLLEGERLIIIGQIYQAQQQFVLTVNLASLQGLDDMLLAEIEAASS